MKRYGTSWLLIDVLSLDVRVFFNEIYRVDFVKVGINVHTFAIVRSIKGLAFIGVAC